MPCTRLYVDPTETLTGQGREKILVSNGEVVGLVLRFLSKVLWMSVDLPTFISSSIGMLGREYLGIGSDMSRRRFPKNDVTGSYSEVTKKRFLSWCIVRDIFAQNLLQKDELVPQLNRSTRNALC